MKRVAFTPGFGLLLLALALAALFGVGLFFRLAIAGKGLQITSWWRSPEKNAAVGGARNSLHMIGLAWDVVPVTQENEDALRSLGLKVINEGDHLHAMLA